MRVRVCVFLLQAELRAAVFLALEEQEKVEVRDPHPTPAPDLDRTVLLNA